MSPSTGRHVPFVRRQRVSPHGCPSTPAFSATDASVGLPWGCIIAVIIAFIYLLCRRVISFKDATGCITKGFVAMVPALMILTFALTLKNMTGLLDSSTFVQGALSSVSGLEKFLPAIIFVVACAISFATGTSWGTMGTMGIMRIFTLLFVDPSMDSSHCVQAKEEVK